MPDGDGNDEGDGAVVNDEGDSAVVNDEGDGAVMTPLSPFHSPYHNRHPHADKNGKPVVAILAIA